MLKDRAAERKKSLLQARIRVSDSVTFDCLVRDISLTGARLQFASPHVLPSAFDLEIPSRAVILRCELQWRRGDALGVRFKGNKATGSS